MSVDAPIGTVDPDAAPEPVGEAWDRFSRAAVMFGVLTTLIAAIVGWRQSDAGKNAQTAAARAHELTVDASRIGVVWQQREHVALSLLGEYREQRAHVRSALQRQVYEVESDPRMLRLDRRHWARLSERTEKRLERLAHERVSPRSQTLGDTSPGGGLSPEADPNFPSLLQARGQRESNRLLALRDAANEENVEWDKRGNRYVAALAMLGMALYLFGFSLSPHVSEVRGFFLGTAVLLLAVAGGWALINVMVPVRTAGDRAAAEYALGRAELDAATGPDGLDDAIAHYTRAIDLRPTSTSAYRERANATFLRSSPQFGAFTSLTSAPALAASIEDLETARYIGSESSAVTADLGFEKFLLGLRRDDDDLIEDSIELTREAIDTEPDNPVPYANLGAAQLALGSEDDARASYRDAFAHTVGTGPKGRTRTDVRDILSGTLTDLELVLRYDRVSRGTARALKELIVGSAGRGKWGPPRGNATIRDVDVRANRGFLEYRTGGYEHFDPEVGEVFAQWYQRTPLGWSHLAGIYTTPFRMAVLNDGSYGDLQAHLPFTLPLTCLPATTYRVELYVRGHLAGEGVGRSSARPQPMTPFVDLDNYVAGCRPTSWERRTLPAGLTGYVDPDAERGLFVMTLDDILRAPDYAKDEKALAETIRRFAQLFPARPRQLRYATYDTNFLGLDYSPSELSRETVRFYDYGRGFVLAGARKAEQGPTTIAFVYGSDVDPARHSEIFDSLVDW